RHTRFSRDWSSDVCSSDLESSHVAPFSRTESPPTLSSRRNLPPTHSPKTPFGEKKHTRTQRVRAHSTPGESSHVATFSRTESPRSEERRVGKGGRAP